MKVPTAVDQTAAVVRRMRRITFAVLDAHTGRAAESGNTALVDTLLEVCHQLDMELRGGRNA